MQSASGIVLVREGVDAQFGHKLGQFLGAPFLTRIPQRLGQGVGSRPDTDPQGPWSTLSAAASSSSPTRRGR